MIRPFALLSCLIAAMALTAPVAAEDTRFFPRPDGGYDFFDFSGSLIGQSQRNEHGSYDFFDRFGKKVGWSSVTSTGRIEFRDAAGALYRIIDRTVDGSAVVYDADGKLMNHSAPSYLAGGTQNYDVQGYATSFGFYGSFVAPSDTPDKR